MTLVEQIKSRFNVLDALHLLGIDPPVGKRHMRCPLPQHDERTGSFQVKQDYFRCYGCGAHGDAIDLVALMLGMDNGDAINHLADRLGISTTLTAKERAAVAKDIDEAKRLRKLRQAAHRLTLEANKDIPPCRDPALLSLYDHVYAAYDRIVEYGRSVIDADGLRTQLEALVAWEKYAWRTLGLTTRPERVAWWAALNGWEVS